MATVITGCSSSVPLSLAPASGGSVYCVNGQQRGFVIAGGTTAYPIGVTAAPAVSIGTTNSPQFYFVSSVVVLDPGENYSTPPSVTVAGLSGPKALLLGDGVASIQFTTSAKTFTSAPAVSLSGGQATDAAAAALLRGSVASVRVNPFSAWYTAPPTVTFAAAANVSVVRTATGRGVLNFASAAATSAPLAAVVITDPGIYEWTGTSISAGARPVSATVSAALTGTGLPSLNVDSTASVIAISAQSVGTNYSKAPAVSVAAKGPLQKGSGVVALASLNGTTGVAEYEVLGGGSGFEGRAVVNLTSEKARPVSEVQPRLSGKFLAGIRFVAGDGTPGNLCPLVELDASDRASSFLWNLAALVTDQGGAPAITDSSPSRIAKVELWRTTSDQAITLYRVAELTQAQVDALTNNKFIDTLTDAELASPDRYAELPILTPDGQPNAFRFGLPPAAMSVVTLFQDRAWYAVDSSAAEPNAIYFSGVDELDSVPAENQLVIQNSGRESEAITGLMPMDGSLYVGQLQNLVRLTTGPDPLVSSSAVPAAQRGMLNDRCWDQFEGVSYIADALGVYAFTGSSAEPISDPVAEFWTTPRIDFTKSKWFFLRVNHKERVVRLYYSRVGSSSDYPKEAICYSLITKSWWEERYAQAVSCGVRSLNVGQNRELLGSTNRMLVSGSGNSDDGSAIAYSMRTGNFPLNKDPKRGLRLTYSPTSGSHLLNVQLFYNNSSTARPNAVATDRGTGVTTTTGSTAALLEMSATRSPLGDATGFAQVQLAGRISDESAGADRHISIGLAGSQSSSRAVIHGLTVEGAG